jgi:enamidase
MPMKPARQVALLFALLFLAMSSATVGQERGAQVEPYVALDEPLIALVGAQLVDGTGSAARSGQTIVIRNGRIEAVGNFDDIEVPEDAYVWNLEGKTLVPGFVMVHEHMFYPAGGGGVYNGLGFSFPRLYLAGGATTIRTAGSMIPYADINLARLIDAEQIPGPDMDVTGPYLNGPGLPVPAVRELRNADDARDMVRYWAGEGATSFKAYMHITRAELGAAIEEAHSRGFKLTGHLCSVTYREAADLGIDNLEHGFFASSDFVEGKAPDACPDGVSQSLVDVDVAGAEFQGLIGHLIDSDVAVTSTMAIFETFAPGRPPASSGALDAMSIEAREGYLRRRAQIAVDVESIWARLLPKGMEMEKAFAESGGLLLAGTDPTGYGGVVAGFSNQRAVELFVEGGFSLEEAIEIATLNGARYLGRDEEVGSIEVGKRADLIIVDGDLSEDVANIRNVEMVFKAGIGYDSAKLIESVAGTVGIR